MGLGKKTIDDENYCGKKVLVRLNGKVFEADLDGKNDLPADVEVFILTVLTKYNYLLG